MKPHLTSNSFYVFSVMEKGHRRCSSKHLPPCVRCWNQSLAAATVSPV